MKYATLDHWTDRCPWAEASERRESSSAVSGRSCCSWALETRTAVAPWVSEMWSLRLASSDNSVWFTDRSVAYWAVGTVILGTRHVIPNRCYQSLADMEINQTPKSALWCSEL